MSRWCWHTRPVPYGQHCDGCMKPFHTHPGPMVQYGVKLYAVECLLTKLIAERAVVAIPIPKCSVCGEPGCPDHM